MITNATSPLIAGGSLTLTGTQFRGLGEAGASASPADFPLVQIRSLGNDQILSTLQDPAHNWSATNFYSLPTPVSAPGGYARVTVFSNGIPSPSVLTLIETPPTIISPNSVTFTVGTFGTFTVATTGIPTPSIVRGGVTLPSGVTFADNGNGTGTLSGTPAAGTSGNYALTFTATNPAGSSAPQSFTFTVGQIPAITSAANYTFTVGTAGTFPVTTSGFPLPSIARGGVALPSGVTFVDNGNGTGTLSGTPAAATGGTYALTFTATSSAGSSAVQNFTLTVNQAPAISSAATIPFTVGTAGTTFTVTASGYPAPTIARGGVALPSGMNFVDNGNGTGTLSGTPAALTGGTYALTFTATNTVGSSAPQSFTLVVNEAPTISSAAAITFTAGSSATPFTVTTTGYPKPSIARGGVALPSGVTFVDNGNGTGTLTGTPGATTGGTYALTFTATNTVASTSPQNFTLTVNQAPAISSAATIPFTVGTAGTTFAVATSGYPAPTIARGGVALPSGMSFVDNGNGTGSLSGTPAALTGGTYALTFTATNTVGSSTPQSFTLIVNEAPTITSVIGTTFATGSAGTFTVTTSGYPKPSIARGGVNLPSAMTFVDNGNGTGTLNGTPGAATGGTYALTFTATNTVSSSAAQNFTLTVNQAPAVSSANNVTFTVGNNTSFPVATTGYPVPSIVRGGALPSGVTFIDNGNGTGALSGTPAALTGGTYVLTFTASNVVGTSSPQSFTLTVNEAPAVASLNNATFTAGSFGTFTISTSGYPKPSIARGGVPLPASVTFVDNGNGTGTLSGTPGAATGGTYALTFTATNTVNSTPAQNFTLTVRQAPAVTSATSFTFTAGTFGTFTVATSGVPAPSIARGGALPSGITFVDNGNGTGTLSGTPAALTGGVYALIFSASNAVGTSAAQNFTLTVNQPPTVTSASSDAFTVGNSGTFTVIASGYPVPSIARGGVSLPGGVTFVDNGNGTGTLGGTPNPGTNGSYTLTFTATNTLGSSAPQNFTLTVTNAPTIQSADHTAFTVGTFGTYTVSAVGSPTPALTRGGVTLPSGVTFVDNGNGTGTLSGTPAADTGGTYALTFSASNGTLPDAQQNFTLTVNQAPAITSVNTFTMTVGSSDTFTVVATGYPAPSIARGGVALPSGVTFVDNGNGTGTLSGMPAVNTGGTYVLTFTATNVVNSTAVQNFTLTVNQAPAITSANNFAFTAGSAGTFSVTTTGYPAPSIALGGVALPSGVTFVDNGNGTGTLSGMPAANAGGSYALTFTADNGALPDALQDFTLTVNQPPAITSLDHVTLLIGVTGTFTVTTTGFPSPSIVRGGVALPSGVTFTDNGNGTATLGGMPAANTGGAYGLTFTASNTVGTDATQNFTLTVRQAPMIVSGPMAVPNPANVGDSVGFSVSATAAAGANLTYTWNFGDGSNGSGASPSHTYTAPGNYTAGVTVSDGTDSASGMVTVTVNALPAVIGSGLDSDGDGFSDAFEIANGSNPNDAASTPFNNIKVSSPSALTVIRPGIKLNFTSGGKDSIQFSGTLPVPAGFASAGQTVFVAVGNVLGSFTLDSKGSAKNGGNTLKITIKASKGIVAAQTSKYAVKLSKGTFAAQLNASGLVNDTLKNAGVDVSFSVFFNHALLQKSQAMSYTSKKGKSGAAK